MQQKTYKTFFLPVRDALDVINGKWRLQIIISISAGNSRFTEIERSIPKITSKVLARELKDLEAHELIQRTIGRGDVVQYSLDPYAKTLRSAIEALREWGVNHRKRILTKSSDRRKV